MNRREPNGTCTERGDVVHLLGNTVEVAHTVTVAVGKGIDQHLVNHLTARLAIPRIGLCRQEIRRGGITGLRYGNRLRVATGSRHNQLGRALLARIGLNQHLGIGLTLSAALANKIAPVGTARRLPGSRRIDGHILLSALGRKGKRGGRYDQVGGRLRPIGAIGFLRATITTAGRGEGHCGYKQRQLQIIKKSFHNLNCFILLFFTW